MHAIGKVFMAALFLGNSAYAADYGGRLVTKTGWILTRQYYEECDANLTGMTFEAALDKSIGYRNPVTLPGGLEIKFGSGITLSATINGRPKALIVLQYSSKLGSDYRSRKLRDLFAFVELKDGVLTFVAEKDGSDKFGYVLRKVNLESGEAVRSASIEGKYQAYFKPVKFLGKAGASFLFSQHRWETEHYEGYNLVSLSEDFEEKGRVNVNATVDWADWASINSSTYDILQCGPGGRHAIRFTKIKKGSSGLLGGLLTGGAVMLLTGGIAAPLVAGAACTIAGSRPDQTLANALIIEKDGTISLPGLN